MMSHSNNRRISQAMIILSAFVALPASAQTINEVMKIVASDAATYDTFGSSVAISGTTAIVGIDGDDDGGFNSGSAILFDTETGLQLFKFIASDPAVSGYFGEAVAISGTIAIIGAYGNEAAYLFDTITGQEIYKLTAADGEEDDRFGFSVAISGTAALVGAHWDDDWDRNSGSAYIFDTTTGQQLFKLTASDGGRDESFGYSVAISDTTALVGAGSNDAGIASGSAYIFDTTTGQELFKLTASDAAQFDFFGDAVAISGTTAIVGARGSGSAYIFNTTTGQELFKLTAADGEEGDRFGFSVAISGTTALVGADYDDDAAGSVYAFDTTTGQQLYKLVASDGAMDDVFGNAVAISGTTALVGARYDDDAGDASGSAYFFNLTGTESCRADLTGEGDLNFLDVSAYLAAFGAGDLAADFTGEGDFNFLDVSAFLAAFAAGCP
tara:strand:- start:261 stop:1583 length:1323 start_codon:yes stop_codon:yes gene_type:complete